MSQYLLIESRDPIVNAADCLRTREFARALGDAGHQVVLFLVSDGVVAARRGCQGALGRSLFRPGVQVIADTLALRERAIEPASMVEHIQCSAVEEVVEFLGSGWKAIWH